MVDRSLFQAAVESFRWDSEEQREGFLALVQYWDRSGKLPVLPLDSIENLTPIFLIQKMHEASEYWRDALGNQISALEDQIRGLQDQVAKQTQTINYLISQHEAQRQTVDSLLLGLKKQ